VVKRRYAVVVGPQFLLAISVFYHKKVRWWRMWCFSRDFVSSFGISRKGAGQSNESARVDIRASRSASFEEA
jgi:hypothetical protein